MTENDNINQAVNLIKAGRREEARALIEDVLDQRPDDPRAWAVLYQLTDTYDEKVFALKQVLRWKPEDKWATQNLAQLDDKEALQKANQHAKEGRREKALSLVDQVLKRDPENAGAWFLKAKFAKNPESAVKSLNQVLRISPRDKRAKEQLARLREPQVSGKKKFTPTMIMLGLAGISIIMGLCVTFGIPAFRGLLPGSGSNGDILGEVVKLPMTSCAELIERALSLTEENCQKIDSNEVCYGNYDVYAEMIPGFSKRFDLVGDRGPIEGFTKLQASPINLDKDVWGIALIKLQANMAGTVPGQNVTFMVFGDTEVNNTSGDMSAFYFSTGFTGVTCDEVPFDGLLIETPEGAGIVFRANGVDFVLQGDAILQAEPDGEMTITMVDGTGQITADGQTQELDPGTSSSVPLDEDLEATGGPSEPEPLSDEEVTLGCELFGVGCPEEEATASPTITPLPIDTGLPTNTSTPFTSDTSTPPPTITSPPGSSPPPTRTLPATNTPPPTNTLVPTATNTSSPMSCSAITVNPVPGDGGKFNITNNNAGDIIITQITLTWPVGTNGKWKRIILEGSTIGNPNIDTSPATITLVASVSQRTIEGSKTEPMVFTFQNSTPASTGYYVVITFDVGCTRSGTQ